MKILFIDQTAKLSGGELALLDIITPYRDQSKVILFEDGPLKGEIEKREISVSVIKSSSALKNIRRGSRIPLSGIISLLMLAKKIAQEAKNYDFIFANSQKAGLISVLAGQLAHKSVVWYLHDIVTKEHFGSAQLLAAKYISKHADQILVNSKATKNSLQQLSGRTKGVHLVYNAFNTMPFCKISAAENLMSIRSTLGFDQRPLIGVFGRLSPWKGQDVFLRALSRMNEVQGLIVGSPLFGEEAYAMHLNQNIKDLHLEDRVKMVGFRKDIPELMSTCDIIAHTSVAPEPFGRVIVEGMLAGRPVVASQTGGPIEIIENGITGLLYTPGDEQELESAIRHLLSDPQGTALMAQRGKASAIRRFSLDGMHERIEDILSVSFKQQKKYLLQTSG